MEVSTEGRSGTFLHYSYGMVVERTFTSTLLLWSVDNWLGFGGEGWGCLPRHGYDKNVFAKESLDIFNPLPPVKLFRFIC